MDVEQEIENYLNCNSEKSLPEKGEFLIKVWKTNHWKSSGKYEVILKYFLKNLHEDLCNIGNFKLVSNILSLKFPPKTISNKAQKEASKTIISMLQSFQSLDAVEAGFSMILNNSYKEYFKNNLVTYCKLVGLIIEKLNALEDNQSTILAEIIMELHYFSKVTNFAKNFLAILIPLHKLIIKNGTISEPFWTLIKAIFFSHSTKEKEEKLIFEVFSKENVAPEHLDVLFEGFIVNFKEDAENVGNSLVYLHEQVLSKISDDGEFLQAVNRIYNILRTHNVEITSLKSKNTELVSGFLSSITEAIDRSANSMKLSDFCATLSNLIAHDPFLFKNNIYKIVAESMLSYKSPEDLKSYELLMQETIKVFGREINQFLSKILNAIDEVLSNFSLPKKRKRKMLEDSNIKSKKKKSLTLQEKDSFDLENIWPNSTMEIFDEIIGGLNVGQTIKLWSMLSSSLQILIEDLQEPISENFLFKIDFISTLFCQLFNASRIHEQLAHKSTEIVSLITEFINIQHLFYNAILNIEYNEKVMRSFLKLSYEFENFMMLYFYHYEDTKESNLNMTFIADKTRMNSNEWKIIHQRVKNFGKNEEKSYYNLLMLQQSIKNDLFDEGMSMDEEILGEVLRQSDQFEEMMRRKDTRIMISYLTRGVHVDALVDMLHRYLRNDFDKLMLIVPSISNNIDFVNKFIGKITLNKEEIGIEEIEVLRQLPIPFISVENKRQVFQMLLQRANELNHETCIELVEKIFKSDGYKTFFEHFTVEQLFTGFNNAEKFQKVYEIIFKNALKKLNRAALENFEKIVNQQNTELDHLLELISRAFCETNVAHVTAISIEEMKNFKLKLINKLLSCLKSSNIKEMDHLFCIFGKICSQDASILTSEIKEKHMALLNKLIQDCLKTTSSAKSIELFIMALTDAKKLNLNDEIKGSIVKTLNKHLKGTIEEKIRKEMCDDDIEKDLIASLNSFKSKSREEISNFMLNMLRDKEVTINQLVYCFNIYRNLFESGEKDSKLISLYMNFFNTFIVDRKEKVFDLNLLCVIFNAHIAMLKTNKDNLESGVIDEAVAFYAEQTDHSTFADAESFCKFHAIIGEFLFAVGNFHQKYCKSRMPQYFNAFLQFMETIYFYKADGEEFTSKEISMLLRLTLQLENIVKMLMKLHSNSFSKIAPYIMSSIVNIFIKNPKMLSGSDKFKVNIKNISYQLLSAFDDKTRKHVYAIVDESTRDVYETLFAELKHK